MSKEAMKLALEALETELDNYKDWDEKDGAPEYIHEAITALREALAEQPAQQEPTEQKINGCICRWNEEGDRVVTCERHQGWLDVIEEWATRAREAEKKLKETKITKLNWSKAPIKTQWGDDMVVADVSIDKDHTLSLYCESSEVKKVEAMFVKQRNRLTHLQRLEVLERFKKYEKDWDSFGIFIDLVESAHNIKENT